MDVQEVDVFIDASGQVRLEVRGVKGPGCIELTAALEAVLGGQVETREMTPEAAEATTVDVVEDRLRQGGAT